MSLQRAETPKQFRYLLGWLLVLVGVPLLSLLAQFSARTAVAQTIEPPPPPPKPPFLIRSYESTQPFAATRLRTIKGKCLDYGIPPAAPNTIGDAGAIGVAGTAVAQTPNSVFVNDCDAAHPIVVEEINEKHEVILHAGSQVIGIHRTLISARGYAASGAASSPVEYPLELINQRLPAAAALVNDVFALDGDSIILASSRCADPASCGPQLVVQLQNARSNNGTPLVLGPRNLAETEFWDFLATDGSNADPTSGFVQVSTRDDLLIAMYRVNQIAQLNNGAAWGSVIKIVGAVSVDDAIDLTPNPAYIDPVDGSYHNLVIPAGVTIRGDRRGTNLGPLIIGNYADTTKGLLQFYYHTTFDIPADHMLEIEGNNVRITGLRIQGPSGSTDLVPEADGIHIGNPYIASEFGGVLIDHNDISDWPLAGVGPYGGHDDRDCSDTSYIGPIDSLQVRRNFIHHNAMQGLGYGIVVGDGAGATILGNTFLMNRHAIASDGDTGDQYSAWDNLVLSRAAAFGAFNHSEQDFDMHGTLSQLDQQHDGGYAGNFVEIAWNTFLGGNRVNFALRGNPCAEPDSYHNNVSQRNSDEAIKVWNYFGQFEFVTSSSNVFAYELTITNNQFFDSSPVYINPAHRLGVGDFDGDGVQDVFLATGTSWFYSPGGKAEWRYLNGGKTDRIDSLLLGDFDGDGRTDVIGKNGNDLMISWGGASDWQKLNTTTAPISDLAVGDFDGDGHADIFWADGVSWYVSSAGSGPFRLFATSSKRVHELRFGHFSICGSGTEADVFGLNGGKWSVSCGARSSWTQLPVSLTNSVNGLFVADFDGDGNADVATSSSIDADSCQSCAVTTLNSWTWYFSHDGVNGWTSHTITPTESCSLSISSIWAANPGFLAGIGQFLGSRNTDILLWGSNFGDNLCVVPGGTGSAQRQSRQDMF